jgi:Rps23 Pro-64 3,4-dihydroxylase Tpa1-like proline 4-hydroxylase
MTYLNYDRLGELDAEAFQTTRPFPWINPAGLLTDEGHRQLVESLPPVSLFKKSFGIKRSHGQRSHNRYVLEYDDSLEVARPWKDFVSELRSSGYRKFIAKMMGSDRFTLNCHWHYGPPGCSVSPHCDAKHKHGSHVFYFNTENDWDPDWGGQTLVLDDGGELTHGAHPEEKNMKLVAASQAMGNHSLLFKRGEHSWHSVTELTCPEGYLRKVFILVVNRVTPEVWLRRLFGRLPRGY